MKQLRLMTSDDVRATLYIDSDPARLVTVHCNEAPRVARQIARCVNMHDGMVQALQMFSSKEMGSLLVDVVVASFEDEEKGEAVGRRLRALINAVDVILKGMELS